MAAAAVMGAAGLSMLREHEGLRTRAYLDPVGIPTICYGHTGPEVRLGLTYTVAQCEQVLAADLAKHRRGLEACVTRPMNPNQRDALVSFAFNVGVPRACGSTLVRQFNAGNTLAAANEFPKWKYGTVRGKATVLPGLVRRRSDERDLFVTRWTPAAAPALSDRLPGILARS